MLLLIEIRAKKYDKNPSRSPKLCIGFYFKQSGFQVFYPKRLVYIFMLMLMLPTMALQDKKS